MIRLLAWALTATGIGVGAAARVLDLMNGRRVPTSMVDLIVLVAFSIVGGLIASRRPRNPIGWIYLVAVVLIAVGGSNDLATQYAYYAVVTRPGSLPAADWVLWVGQLGSMLGFFGLLTLPLLLFPDGRLPSPRRSSALRCAGWQLRATLGLRFPTWSSIEAGLHTRWTRCSS